MEDNTLDFEANVNEMDKLTAGQEEQTSPSRGVVLFDPVSQSGQRLDDINDYERLRMPEYAAQARKSLSAKVMAVLQTSDKDSGRRAIAQDMARRSVATRDGLTADQREALIPALEDAYFNSPSTIEASKMLFDAKDNLPEVMAMDMLGGWLEKAENLNAIKGSLPEMGFATALMRSLKDGLKEVAKGTIGAGWALSKEFEQDVADARKNLAAAIDIAKSRGIPMTNPEDPDDEDWYNSQLRAISEEIRSAPADAQTVGGTPKTERQLGFEAQINKELEEALSEYDKTYKDILAKEWLQPNVVGEFKSGLKNFSVKTAATVGNLGGQMALTAALTPLLGPVTGAGMYARILGGTYIQGMERGVPHERSMTAGVVNGIVQAPFEMFQMGQLLSPQKIVGGVPALLRHAARTAGEEYLTEVMQDLPEKWADYYLSNEETAWQNAERLGSTLSETLGESLKDQLPMIPATLILGAPGMRNAYLAGRNAQTMTHIIEKTVEAVKGSKAIKDSPLKVEEAMNHMAQENGLEQSTISAQKLYDIYQEQAASMARRFGYAGDFNEVLENNGVVPIDLGKVIVSRAIDATEAGQALGKELIANIRFAPDALTAEEANLKDGILRDRMNEAIAQQEERFVELREQEDIVGMSKMFREKFREAGMREEVADAAAELWTRVSVNISEMMGISYSEISERMNDYLEVTNGEASLSEDGFKQMIGSIGAKRIDAVDNNSRRMSMLTMAKAMAQSGMNSDVIWAMTGWNQNAGGDWVQEIPYGDFNKDAVFTKNKGVIEARGMDVYDKHTLGDVFDAPDLYKAYPEIAKLPVYVYDFGKRLGGEEDNTIAFVSRSGDENGIHLNVKYIAGSEKAKVKLSGNEARSFLIHEIQHLIQYEEGFPIGTSAEAAEKYVRAKKTRASSDLKKFIKIAQASGVQVTMDDVNAFIAGLAKDSEDGVKEAEAVAESIIDRMGKKDAEKLLKTAIKSKTWNTFANMDAFEIYQRYAGEVEARNAEKRAGMTLEERKTSSPNSTTDYAPEEQIIQRDISYLKLARLELDAEEDLPTSFKQEAYRALDDAERLYKQEALGVTNFVGTFIEHGKATVTLFKNSNDSTFFHESAHVWLNIMKDFAAMPEGVLDGERAIQNKADFETLLAWQGMTAEELNDPAKLTSLHEHVARAFEAYLREGKAPTQELKDVFRRIKEWLMDIYKSIRDIAAQAGFRASDIVSPEVRNVFDRWFTIKSELDYAGKASGIEAEIEALAAQAVGSVTFNDLLKKRLPKQSLEEKVSAQVEKRVQAAQKRWDAERKKAEEERIRSELNNDPACIIRKEMRSKGNGLDLAAVKEISPELARRMPVGSLLKEGGRNPHQVAMEHGYDSALAMLEAVVAAKPFETAVKERIAIAQKDFEIEDGRLSNNDIRTLVDEAMHSAQSLETGLVLKGVLERLKEAPEGDARKDIVRTLEEQIKASSEPKSKKPKRPSLEKIMAQQMVAKAKDILYANPVRSANPRNYMNAEGNAARSVKNAILDGDFDKAYENITKQIKAHSMAIAALEIKKEVQSGEKKLKDAAKIGRSGTSSVDAEALDQARQILVRFNIFRGDLSNVNHVPLAQWERVMREEMGESPVIADWILSGDLPPSAKALNIVKPRLSDLTVTEFLDVVDAVTSIIHIGRGMRMAMTDARGRSLAEISEGIQDSIAAIHGLGDEREYTDEKARNVRDYKKSFFGRMKAFLSEHRKVEFILREADGNKDMGAAWRGIFRPMYEAQNNELTQQRLMSETIASLMKPLEKYKLDQVIDIPSIKGGVTLEQALAIALNTGTELNYARLMNSHTPEQVSEVVAALTEDQWDFVQGVWDTLGTLWPQAEALEMEVTGVKPQRQKAVPVVTKYGTYSGGYYPIVYNIDFSTKTQQQEELARNNYDLVPHTAKGYLKPRLKVVDGRPLELTLAPLTHHLNSVIHDLTHRKAVRDVARLLNDRGLQDAMFHAVGREAYNQLMPWLRDIAKATGGPSGAPVANKTITHLKNGATIASLGWNVFSGIKQHLSIFQAATRVGAAGAARAYADFLSYLPPGSSSYRRDKEAAFSLSAEMRTRAWAFDREVSELLSQPSKYSAKVLESFCKLMQIFDERTCVAVWKEAHDVEIERSGNPQKAIEFADSVVRQTQPMSLIKDKAAILRDNNGAVRLFTMFYTAFSNTFNLLNENVFNIKHGKIGDVVVSALTAFVLPAMTGCLFDSLRGFAPDEPEKQLEWWFWNTMLYPANAVIGLRDIANIVKTRMTSDNYAASVQLTPIQGVYDSFDRIVRNLTKGDSVWNRNMFRDIMTLSGYAKAYPARQLSRSLLKLYEIAKGEKEASLSEIARLFM